jgi:sulfonate transport system ATP-binding protein
VSITRTGASASAPALPVRLDAVGRSFAGLRAGDPRRTVLSDVTLDIAPGEIVSLLGPSGCGKSTLLRQISGLDTPDSGTIHINDSAVTGIDQRCAVAFQEPRLLPWRTVARNVELGVPRGTERGAGRERVAELLSLVQLGDASGLRPRQISGGMAQRASLARALARGPGVLVLDEPFGALDALTRLTMQDLLLEIHAVEPATIVLVTHDVDEALYLSDRVVLLGENPAVPRGSGSGIRSIVSVPGARPRDRGDADLALLRAELLDGLGVSTHRSAPQLVAQQP